MKFFSRTQKLLNDLTYEANYLSKKKLVPRHTLGFLQGHNIKKAVEETKKDMIKEFVCPVCGIILHNRMFMREHSKLHSHYSRYQEKTKDDAAYNLDSRVYL